MFSLVPGKSSFRFLHLVLKLHDFLFVPIRPIYSLEQLHKPAVPVILSTDLE
jgi:hypothetical protein